MIVLRCKDAVPDCDMDNMCCDFCTRNKLDCDGCDEDCLTCGCAIPESDFDKKYLTGSAFDVEFEKGNWKCK